MSRLKKLCTIDFKSEINDKKRKVKGFKINVNLKIKEKNKSLRTEIEAFDLYRKFVNFFDFLIYIALCSHMTQAARIRVCRWAELMKFTIASISASVSNFDQKRGGRERC